MKSGYSVLFAFLLFPAAVDPVSHLRYVRPITAVRDGEACAILDAEVMAHAAPSLKDLRLFSAEEKVPYVITLSETVDLTDESATATDIHSGPAHTEFNLRMPGRPYTEVKLDVRQQDFVVTATVSGSNELASPIRTPLGSFTLFDLTRRHLSRDTTLPLQESAFRYLHVDLRGDRIASGAILGAQVPPSRQAQTVYTSVASAIPVREGTETVATLRIPAHVPLERVSIELTPGFGGNFDRAVRVTGRADDPNGPVETIEGHVMRVHSGKIQEQRTSFDAGMGVNLQHDATIRIAIENGTDAPLPVSTMRLEMRQRSLCFSAPATSLNLLYGDPSLPAPLYPTSSRRNLHLATLGAERLNPAYVERSQPRTAINPDLWWLLLLAGFGAGGTVALHFLRKRSSHHG